MYVGESIPCRFLDFFYNLNRALCSWGVTDLKLCFEWHPKIFNLQQYKNSDHFLATFSPK